MPSFRSIFVILLISLVLVPLFPDPAGAQSGRGRRRVTTREAEPPPPPVIVPEITSSIKQDALGSATRFRLKNGMTVVISEQHAAPLVAMVSTFRSSDDGELDVAAGVLAAYERAVNGETAETLRSLGVLWGSTATADGPVFYMIAPPTSLKEAIGLQLEALNSVSSEMEEPLETRTTAVLLEPNRAWRQLLAQSGLTTDATEGSASALRRFTYLAGSRVRSSPKASSDPVSNPAADSARRLLRPEKLIISIAGNVPTVETLTEIQRRYAGFPPAAPVPSPGPKDATAPRKPQPTTAAGDQQPPPASESAEKPSAPAEGLLYALDRAATPGAVVTLGFNVSGVDDKQRAAIEVLRALMGVGRGSRLHRLLVDDQRMVSTVGAELIGIGAGRFFILQMQFPAGEPDPGLDRAESSVFRELDRIRRQLPSEGELVRAKSMLEKEHVDRDSIYLGRALLLARAESSGGDFREALRYRELIRAVTAEQVQQAAARFFGLNAAVVHEYLPVSAPERVFDSESYSRTVAAWAAGFGRPVDPKNVAAADEDAQAVVQGNERSFDEQALYESIQPQALRDFSTYSGPKAFVKEDRSRPKVTVAILFQGGRLIEQPATSGTTELMLRSMLFASARRSADEVVRELEQLGAEIEMVLEPDYFGVELSVLSRNADHAVRLVRDLIEEPAFRETDVEQARAAQLRAIRDSRHDPLERAEHLLAEMIFPGHAYAFSPHGGEQVVAATTVDQLKELHQKSIKRQLPLVVIVGDTQGSALVAGPVADGFRRRDLDATIQVKAPQGYRRGERTESASSRWSRVIVGYPGPKAGNDDRTALELLSSAIRSRLAATGFRADVRSESRFSGGWVVTRLFTYAGSEQAARDALRAAINRVSQSGLSEAEREVALEQAVAEHNAVLQVQSERAGAYAEAIYCQRKPEEVDHFRERLSEVKLEDAKRVAAEYLKPESSSVVVLRATGSR